MPPLKRSVQLESVMMVNSDYITQESTLNPLLFNVTMNYLTNFFQKPNLGTSSTQTLVVISDNVTDFQNEFNI